MGSINFGQLAKDSVTTLEGDFPLTVVEAEAKRASTGSLMAKLKLKVESGPYANRPVYTNLVLSPDSPGALRRFFGTCATLGLDEKFFASIPSDLDDDAQMAYIAKTLIGRRAVCTLGSREWQGVKSEEITAWKPAIGGPGGTGAGSSNGVATARPLAPAATAARPLSTPAAEATVAAVSVSANLPSEEPPDDPF